MAREILRKVYKTKKRTGGPVLRVVDKVTCAGKREDCERNSFRSRVEIEKMDLNLYWFFLDFKGERYRSFTEFPSPSPRFQLR